MWIFERLWNALTGKDSEEYREMNERVSQEMNRESMGEDITPKE